MLAGARVEPSVFRRLLVIESRGRLARLSDVIEPWQKTDFEGMDEAWKHAIGVRADSPGVRIGYFERARGHSKTTDLAVMALWALWASDRTVSGMAAANDREQADVIRKQVEKLLILNPWVSSKVQVQLYRVLNLATRGEMKIMSGDARSGFGRVPDFIVADELTHWTNEDFWTTVFSTVAKRPNCLISIITNAGMGKGVSWQWRVRESLREDSACYFSRLDGPVASWMTSDALDLQRRNLPSEKAFNRLWLNRWQTETGDVLEEDDIAACTTLPGPVSARGDMRFLAGLDLGVKNDHSALVVIGIDIEAERFKLASVQSWAPSEQEGGKVRLSDVTAACIAAHERFGLDGIAYDPDQAYRVAEECEDAGITMIETPFTPKNCTAMARVLLSVFTNRLIDLYDDPLLVRDLLRLSIVERPSGFKIEAVRDELGHCDRGIALSIVLPLAEQWLKYLLDNRHREPLEDVVYA